MNQFQPLFQSIETSQHSTNGQNFQNFDTAINRLGLGTAVKLGIWQIIAGLYALNSVEFQNDDATDDCTISPSSQQLLDLSAKLLSLNKNTLADVLTTRSIKPISQNQNMIV